MAWTSVDGISWDRAAAMQAADDQAVIDAGLTEVAASDDRYVAAGGNWVLTSTDGRTWARPTYLEGGWGSLATIGDRFFASTGYGVKVSSSSDGADWLAVEVDPWLPGTEVQEVRWRFASTQGIAVAVGSAWDESSTAMVSVGK